MTRMITPLAFFVFFVCGSIASHTAAFTKADAKTKTSKAVSLRVGDAAGAFYVTKMAGAEADGVKVGTELCYRCRYGSRPIVMVFTRSIDGQIPQLIQQLDKAVSTNKESQLRGLVTLLGSDTPKAKELATNVAEKSAVKNIPVVIAKEIATGPVNYKLSASAEVTIVIAIDSQIVSTQSYKSDEIDVDAVIAKATSQLK